MGGSVLNCRWTYQTNTLKQVQTPSEGDELLECFSKVLPCSQLHLARQYFIVPDRSILNNVILVWRLFRIWWTLVEMFGLHQLCLKDGRAKRILCTLSGISVHSPEPFVVPPQSSALIFYGDVPGFELKDLLNLRQESTYQDKEACLLWRAFIFHFLHLKVLKRTKSVPSTQTTEPDRQGLEEEFFLNCRTGSIFSGKCSMSSLFSCEHLVRGTPHCINISSKPRIKW